MLSRAELKYKIAIHALLIQQRKLLLKYWSDLKSINNKHWVKNQSPHVCSLARCQYIYGNLLYPLWQQERKPIPVSTLYEWGVPHWGPSLLACHWSTPNMHQFKTRHNFLPSLHNSQQNRQSQWVCRTAWEIIRVGLRMPVYSTNMRLKFPIVALVLEVITIILFGVFAVYDDGKSHGHNGHDGHNEQDKHDGQSNETHAEKAMDLYPSKFTWAACWQVLCCCMSECLVVWLCLF